MSSKTKLSVAVSLPLLASVVAFACGNESDSANSVAPLAPAEGNPANGSGMQGPDTAASGEGMGSAGAGTMGTGMEAPPNPTSIDMGAGGAVPGGEDTPQPAARPMGTCDIYGGAGVPCVAAYSLVRALSSTYDGPLYQVRRGAPNPLQNTGIGGETQDIGILPNGFADGAAEAAFCADQTCTVSVLYDQSGQGNNLTVAKAGCYIGTASEDDWESTTVPLAVGGNAVRGLFMEAHEGYRNNEAVNTPEGEAEAGMYMVASGSGSRPLGGPGCCWNFGIASRDNCYGPTGMMNALFFGTAFWGEGAGNGPWFMGDFEAGIWAGGVTGRFPNEAQGIPMEEWPVNENNPSMTMAYAFGILKSRPNNYALRMGDAQQGALTTAYDGPTPLVMTRWQMEGGIILGIGGDNSNSNPGRTFFEGAITAGRPTDELDAAILQNVQAAGYGR